MTKFYEYSIERIKNGNCVVLINNLHYFLIVLNFLHLIYNVYCIYYIYDIRIILKVFFKELNILTFFFFIKMYQISSPSNVIHHLFNIYFRGSGKISLLIYKVLRILDILIWRSYKTFSWFFFRWINQIRISQSVCCSFFDL